MGVNGKLTPISSGFGRAAAAPSLSIICNEIAVRGSVSRVLCAYPKKRRRSFIWDARYRTPRATYPDDDPKTRPYAVSIWSCSRRGLPCHCRYRQRGALLPHPFTLTLLIRRWERRFAFCGTFPGVTSAGRYPAPCFRGARTFLPHCCERPPDPLTAFGIGRSRCEVKQRTARKLCKARRLHLGWRHE